MSSLRVVGANRTTEPDRRGPAAQANSPSGTTGFPETLGSASNALERPQTGQAGSLTTPETQQALPAQNTNRGSQRHSPHEKSPGGQGVAVTDPIVAPVADPATQSLAENSAIPTEPNRDAPPEAVLPWRGSGAGGQNVTAAPIANEGGRRLPTRRGPEETGATHTLGAAGPNLTGATSGGQFAAGSSPEGDSNGHPMVSRVADEVRLAVLAGAGANPDVTRETSQEQTIAPDGSDTSAAAHADPASLSADPATLAVSDISGLSFSFSDLSAMNPIPDALERSLVIAARLVSDDNDITAPFRSAPRSSDDFHLTASPGLVANAPTSMAGNTASAGSPVGNSPASAAANLSPTDLSAQLFHHVVGSAEAGGREVVLQLHPPELGDLTVRVLVTGRGVSAWFASPQIPVQQAISQAIGQLQTDLGNAGYNLTGAWVGADAGSTRERDARSLVPQQRGAVDSPSSEGSTGLPTLSAASGVSIYV